MSLRSTLGISSRWFQIVLASVAVAVSLILWLLRGAPDIARVLVFVFVTETLVFLDLLLPVLFSTSRFRVTGLSISRCCFPIGAIGSFAAALILYWLYPPLGQDTGH